MKTREERIISGKARFIDDIDFPGMAHMAFVNSTQAHAKILEIDTSRAEKEPGVLQIITGTLCREHTNQLPKQADFEHPGWVFRPVHVYALPVDKVHWYGEPVAAVVAEDERTARRAAQHIKITYEPLPLVHDAQQAIKPGQPKIYDEVDDNSQIQLVFDFGAPEQAFAEADQILELEFSEGRVTGLPIEPRGFIADFNSELETLTLWGTFQSPYLQRHNLAATLGMPESRIIINTVDIGGSFGLKIHTWKENIVALASKLLGRPVKYFETMSDFLQNGPHQRDVHWTGQVAFKHDGQVLGLKTRILQDLGAESSNKGIAAFGLFAACASAANMYHWKGLHLEAVGALSNKSFYCAYRGYGKDKGLKFCEYLMNQVARKLDMRPEDVRFRNMIQPNELPRLHINGYYLDSGDYPATLQKAIELSRLEDWRKQQIAARKEGRLMGIGVVNTIEPAGAAAKNCQFPGFTQARVRLNIDGSVEVYSDRTEIGQGAERSHVQIVAQTLGCPKDKIYVKSVSSDLIGQGPLSSRGSVYPASAVAKASRLLREKIIKCAAALFHTTTEQIDFQEGLIVRRDSPDLKMSFQELASRVNFYPGLPALPKEILHAHDHLLDVTTTWYSPTTPETGTGYTTFCISADVAVVEVDKDTGKTSILKYTHVHDAGTIIDKQAVEGQIHGGITQALGESLFEEVVYDDQGTIRNKSLGEYLLPTALDVPEIEIGHLETPSPFTETGSKGMGEAPTISGKAAILAALDDAFAPLHKTVNFAPATPHRLWQLIQESEGSGQNWHSSKETI